MDKNEKLFTDFPPISTEKWKEKIMGDLKGADYEKKLVWKTLEGFKVSPFYREEDLKDKSYLQSLPGEYPFLRGNNKNSNDWDIRQDFDVQDEKKANEKAITLIKKGVTSLGFRIKKSEGLDEKSLSALLQNIDLSAVRINFTGVSQNHAVRLIEGLANFVSSTNVDPTLVKGSINLDPLSALSFEGNKGNDINAQIDGLKGIVELTSDKLPLIRVLCINGQNFTNAGATIVQELGYSLAMASEYLTKLSDKGLSVDTVANHMQFNFGVSSNYFMEIAKIRAARYLWSKIVEAYNTNNPESSAKTHIHSITSDYNQTIYDPYVNVLRTTTEAMSAVIGGTDSLTVKPFDAVYASQTPFSERIARNIQIIIKEESYFDKIIDPASGSYYIENLTDSIITEAWNIFLNVDANGGYLDSLEKGDIQNNIAETAGKKAKLVAQRRDSLLGTNQFPNIEESVTNNIDKNLAFKGNQSEGDEKTIKLGRAATEFEKLRLATETSAKRPVAFMLTYGNLIMRKARASFSYNFFGCAGYKVVDNLGFDSAKEGVEAAMKENADIIVVCSSDDEYPVIAPAVKELVNGKAIVAVAGAPACMDELKNNGIEHFVHMKSNALETLQGFNKLLKIQ